MTGNIRRTLGYRRVSGYEQGRVGTSLDGQRAEQVAYCQYSELPEPIDFCEVESGAAEKQERRVEIARLMASVRPGDLVIVSKLDRWSRDTLFTLASVREIIRRGADFLSLAERFDARTPEGELQMTTWASIAQIERAKIAERTVGRRRALRAAGRFVEGAPPFGYRRAKGRDGADKPRHLEVDPERGPIVQEMFDMCIRGHSSVEISRHFRARDVSGSKFVDSWVIRVLKNRMYTGQIALTPVRPNGFSGTGQLPAEWVDAHEPLVSMETFQRAQHALRERRKGGDRPHELSSTANWLIRGLVLCGVCGASCAAAPNWKASRHKHPGYYICRMRLNRTRRRVNRPVCTRGQYIRQTDADAVVERLTLDRLAELRGALLVPPPPRKGAPNFDAKRADIAARRKRLVSAVASGKLRLDDIDAHVRELDAQAESLEAEAAAYAAERTGDSLESRRVALAFVENVTEAWCGLTPPERREVIATLAEVITIPESGPPVVKWRDASGLAVAVSSSEAPPVANPAPVSSTRPTAPASAADRVASTQAAARRSRQTAAPASNPTPEPNPARSAAPAPPSTPAPTSRRRLPAPAPTLAETMTKRRAGESARGSAAIRPGINASAASTIQRRLPLRARD